ncbi:hypothetical protein QN277_010773 [Acacia crassicarpa]|uniref:Protein MIZU-KUSSEI 1-like n=1 Tax=Acacia crassicarpa TaxID=499986 RepID=A0AAE1JHF2_9FABA|nr:hypothetical protein QN277_010773 [Acacia crassicarpa]
MAPPLLARPEDSPAHTNSITSSSTPDRDSITLRPPSISLQPAKIKKPETQAHKLFRKFRSVFRSFPIITPPSCKFPVSLTGGQGTDKHIHGGIRITGTLFGHRKARVNLAFQQNPKCLPFLLLELTIPTAKLIQDMGTGLMRIALECEKNPKEKTKIIDEPMWTLFCNGKKSGYGVKREPSEDDLNVMQLLHAVSTGVGVLPAEMADPQDGDLSYMRANFERVIGSKDSETYYMMMPDGNNSELSVFFVRI